MRKTRLEKDQRRDERDKQAKEKQERIKRQGGYFEWTETEKEYRGVWVSVEPE